jgi:DNA-binding beta-propeller fold protein YncE
MTGVADRPTRGVAPSKAPVPLSTAIPASRAPYRDGYPTLFRRGHQFEIALGQRLALGGFKGPTDVAFGPDGWLYVMNRYPNDGHLAGVRWVQVNLKDDGYEFEVVPKDPPGKPGATGHEWLGSLQMTVCDSQGVLYSADEHRHMVVRCSINGETLGHWGQPGEKPGQLNGPTGMCLDADESLWIVNTLNHRIDHYTREGEWLGGFGRQGTGPGQLNFPWGVAIDPINGTVVVADWRNNLVKRFSREGKLLQVIGRPGHDEGELHRPAGIAVDSDGDIYVADRGNNRVLSFNYRGMFIESFIGDAVVNDRGMQKVLTNLDMVRMRDNIENLNREKRLKAPVSVRVDNKGRVYIADTGRYRVQVYRKMCKVLRPDEVDPPTLHVDPVLT